MFSTMWETTVNFVRAHWVCLTAGLVQQTSAESSRNVIGRRLADKKHSSTTVDDDETSPLQSKRSSMLRFPLVACSLSSICFLLLWVLCTLTLLLLSFIYLFCFLLEYTQNLLISVSFTFLVSWTDPKVHTNLILYSLFKRNIFMITFFELR